MRARNVIIIDEIYATEVTKENGNANCSIASSIKHDFPSIRTSRPSTDVLNLLPSVIFCIANNGIVCVP
jgi:hypothetical protein